MPRWEGVNKPGQRCSAELLLAAHNTAVTTKNGTGGAAAAGEVTPELAAMFEGFWSEQQDAPLRARNKILAAICPQLHGMFLVKLATMLTLAGGVRRTEGGTSIRGDVHMLLIGDPGIGEQSNHSEARRLGTLRCRLSIGRFGLGSCLFDLWWRLLSCKSMPRSSQLYCSLHHHQRRTAPPLCCTTSP